MQTHFLIWVLSDSHSHITAKSWLHKSFDVVTWNSYLEFWPCNTIARKWRSYERRKYLRFLIFSIYCITFCWFEVNCNLSYFQLLLLIGANENNFYVQAHNFKIDGENERKTLMRMTNSLAFWLAFSEKIRSGQNKINSVTPKVLVSLSYMWTAERAFKSTE